MDIKRRENESEFEYGLRLIENKCEKTIDLDWQDIVELLNLDCHRDSLRKACNVTDYSAYNVMKYFKEKIENMVVENSEGNGEELLRELQAEKIKVRTLLLEKNKKERQESRRDLYHETMGCLVEAIPMPDIKPLFPSKNEEVHILDFADVHYNAEFKSITNTYSRAEAQERFKRMLGETIEYVQDNKIEELYIANCGDSLQGILRMSDLKLNDIGVLDSLIEFQKVMASFLNELSVYCKVRYYHVNSANHTELRLLNAKAGSMAVEDMEKIIVNYLHDILDNNDRIYIHTDFTEDNIQFEACGFNFVALHGHQIKNVKNSIRDLSEKYDMPFDFCLLGHYHSGVEMVIGERKGYAKEVLVSPSFVGTCPYADKLMVGGKAMAKIHKFVKGKGRKSTYNIILN